MAETTQHHSKMRHVVIALLSSAAVVLATASSAVTNVVLASTPSCSVSWTGAGSENLWTNPDNWSTDAVPGSSSNVCISATYLLFVSAVGSQSVHSLQIGPDVTLLLGASNGKDSMTVATLLADSGNVELYDSTLTAGSISNLGSLYSQGVSRVTSPALSGSGAVGTVGGRLTLVDPPLNLSGGTLTGGDWAALNGGILILPGDITTLNASLGLSGGAAIEDAKGANALAGLSAIDAGAQLGIDGGAALSVAGNLTTQGTVFLGSYASGGGSLTVGGSYTQLTGGSTSLDTGTLTAKQVDVGSGSNLQDLGGNLTTADLHNDGFVQLFGRVQDTGSYTQTATGTLTVGESSTPFTVGGAATLAGTLQLYVFFSPVPGTRFTALTFASRSGNFNHVTIGFKTIPSTTKVDVVAEPQISVNPTSISAGQSASVNGGDFHYQDSVAIYLDSTSGVLLQTVKASRAGFFQTTVTIPTGTKAGTHTLIAVGTSGRTAKVTFRVP